MVALVVTLALGALGASSASAALPEFSGTFPTQFTGTYSQVKMVTVSDPENPVKCTKARFAGTITGPKAATVSSIEFTECSSIGFGNCTSAGAKTGEIKTEKLPLAPVFIAKTKKEQVGLDFNYEENPKVLEWAKYTSFTCGGSFAFTMVGSIIAPTTSINKKGTNFTYIFRQNKGTPEPKKWENEKGEEKSAELYSSLNGGKDEVTGLESLEDLLTTNKAIEIKA